MLVCSLNFMALVMGLTNRAKSVLVQTGRWLPRNSNLEVRQFPVTNSGNGIVDAGDYVSWRKNDGTQAGYQNWRGNFGKQQQAVAARRSPTS